MKSQESPNNNGPELGRVAAKLFFAITEKSWRLKEHELMTLAGLTSHQTLTSWRRAVDAGEPIDMAPDTLERLSLIAGIRKGIEMLSPKAQWDEWIRKPNRAFGGQSPLERMLTGRVVDLREVRQYLDTNQSASFQ